MTTASYEISEDMKAALLLCGHFGREADTSTKALTVAEYGRLEGWLGKQRLRPADLLGSGAREWEALGQTGIDLERLRGLLRRGTLMALSVERWLRSGLWVVSRGDEAYPSRLKKRLGSKAPVLLYGAGDRDLLERGGLAIVGSRNADECALTFAGVVSAACARERIAVVSGGARGVDSAAMSGASRAGGDVTGVLADGLLGAVRRREVRVGLEEGRLVLVSPYHPEAGFDVGHAMARNRYIYGLADHALVVQADLERGGTWAGAVESLKAGWAPLFVKRLPGMSGNEALIKRGGRPFEYVPEEHQNLRLYLAKGVATVRASRVPEAPEVEVPAAKEALVPYGDGLRPNPEQPFALDLYSEFLRRLPHVIRSRGASQREMAKALRLQLSQIKAWAERAEGDGVLERKGKRGKYRLTEKRLF